jgi:hypothetical protein
MRATYLGRDPGFCISSALDLMSWAWLTTLVMQIQVPCRPSGHLAIQCRGSRRTWKFGENPARSRHCVSLERTALP